MVSSFIEFLNEARKNPHLNIKISPFEEIKKIISDNNINKSMAFITMHDINKIGFYTGISHGTPIAIYTYPISYVYDNESTLSLPYKQDSKYISLIVLRNDTKTLNLSNLSRTEFIMYSKKLTTIAERDYHLDNSVISSLFTSESRHSKIFIKSGKDTNGYKLYNAINIIAEYLGNSPIERSKILRAIFIKLGVDAVKDEGHGIISVEPSQTMIVNLKCIDKVHTILNKNEKLSRDMHANKQKFKDNTINKLLKYVINKQYGKEVSDEIRDYIEVDTAVQYKALITNVIKALNELNIPHDYKTFARTVALIIHIDDEKTLTLTPTRIFLLDSDKKPILSKTFNQYKTDQLSVISEIFNGIPLNEYISDIEGFNYDED